MPALKESAAIIFISRQFWAAVKVSQNPKKFKYARKQTEVFFISFNLRQFLMRFLF